MVGNKTVSMLTFVPEAEDNGAALTCRAHNPNIPGQGMHTTTVLQVNCEYLGVAKCYLLIGPRGNNESDFHCN